MSSSRPVTALVTCAANGDQRAWDSLVERYAPLVWSICRRYQLDGSAAADVGQAVWLQLADHLSELREPAAVASWLAATTRRECSRARSVPDAQTPTAGEEQELLAAERDATLREAITRLPRGCQQLIALIVGDSPPSYAQISAELGIPAASIGPRCRRCLGKLRRDPAIAALLDRDPTAMETEPQGRPLRAGRTRDQDRDPLLFEPGGCDSEPGCGRAGVQAAVPHRDDEAGITKGHGAGQVDGIRAAQRTLTGKLACVPLDGLGELYRADSRPVPLPGRLDRVQVSLVQVMVAGGRGQCGPDLGIGKPARDCGVAAIP